MKVRKKIFKILKVLFSAVILILIVGVAWNGICSRMEHKKLDNVYGKRMEVDGNLMTVEVLNQSTQGEPIVLLPGWGSASPVLEFKPLAEQLSKEYTVITIEPFGYGLSDGTDRVRSIENITEELRECVRQLGYEEYYLMGHSISGLYSLYWANAYPEEVQGVIGIDPSVPHMTDKENEPFPISTISINKLTAYAGKAMNVTGLARLLSAGRPENAVYADFSYPYSEEELETFRLLSINCAYNKTVMNEMDCLEENIAALADYKFPEGIPVLEFISKENCDMMPAWEKLHEDTLKEDDEMLILDGSHYLHFEQREEIVSETFRWLRE